MPPIDTNITRPPLGDADEAGVPGAPGRTAGCAPASAASSRMDTARATERAVPIMQTIMARRSAAGSPGHRTDTSSQGGHLRANGRIQT
jgi:hypothetical protein